MNLRRGDVGMARFPHAAGARGKKRPVVVVQSDSCNSRLRHVIVAEVTSNLAAADDPSSLLVQAATPEGQAAGLTRDSVVCCLFLATVAEDRILPIGRFTGELLDRLNACLKSALDLG